MVFGRPLRLAISRKESDSPGAWNAIINWDAWTMDFTRYGSREWLSATIESAPDDSRLDCFEPQNYRPTRCRVESF